MDITQSEVKELLRYDQSKGLMYWRPRDESFFTPTEYKTAEHICKIWNSKYAYKKAGSLNKTTNTYRICILRKNYELSRVIWFYMTGYLPPEVGHRDKNMRNNKWSNLCISENVSNHRNRPPNKKNKSKIVGVHWHKRDSLWRAKIRAYNKEIGLGYHKSLLEACCARKAAEIKYGYMEHLKAAKHATP